LLPCRHLLAANTGRRSTEAGMAYKIIAVPWVLALALAVCVAGCAGLPSAGPRTSEVVSQADSAEAHRLGIVLVEVTADVTDVLKERRPASLSGAFGEGAPALPVINIGDVLSISIWEAGSGSLFSTPTAPGQPMPASRSALLPNMAVQPDGMITVPYAGRVAVAGLEPAAAESAIAGRLRGKALDPQVLVTVASSVGNSVTIGGASGSARVPLSVKGDRILDVIATAGGLHISPDDAVIYLTRGGSTVAVAYDDILDNPRENIFLKSGDLITVAARPPAFLAFGAVQRNGQIPFDAHVLTLAEAVAKSAGLSDSRADPEGLFLFRYETADMVRKFAPGRVPETLDAPVPVIYHLNLRDTAQYFLARQFMVQDKDMIYVAGAPLNDLQKFFGVIGSVLAPAANAVGVGAAATTLSK
jgi:polysaccharide export outer membrane protein